MLSLHGSHSWASCGVFVTYLFVLPFLLFVNKNMSESYLIALHLELYILEGGTVSS